jgi:hypothetical protein
LRIVLREAVNKLAEASIRLACSDSIAVVLSPESISVTIVLRVPLGPIPVLMNKESIMGVACPALAAVAVASGLGLISLAA